MSGDLDTQPLDELFDRLTEGDLLARVLLIARQEDLGAAGDVTTRSLRVDCGPREAVLVIREEGVVAGLAAVPAVLQAFGGGLAFAPAAADGDHCPPGRVIGRITGGAAAILAVERTLLNILSRLCGIATLTRRYVDVVAMADVTDGTKAVICDTRKTTPGLRGLEKYAVACGGGTLHRTGLYDAALYKDNHLALLPGDLAESLTAAIRTVRAEAAPRFVEVEVDTLDQFARVLAIEAGLVDFVLLDNMTPAGLRRAVDLRDAAGSAVRLEASGGVALDTVRAIAESGVDRISVGALTHSSAALDVGLDMLPAGGAAGARGAGRPG